MTRIWFQKHTVPGRVPALDAMYDAHFARVVPPGVEVATASLPEQTYDRDLPEGMVRYGSAEVLFATHFVSQAVVAERAGFDAYVIGTSQDPGLREARSLVGIPVVGYGETAFHFAAMAGQRFGVIGFIPELAEPLADNIERYGLRRWFTGFEYLSGGAETLRAAFAGDHDRFLSDFRAAAAALLARGAEAIVPGEGLPNELLVHLGVSEVDGAPVIDADGLAVRHAAFLVESRRLGVVGPTTRGYWHRKLPADTVDHLRGVFLANPVSGGAPPADAPVSKREE